MKIVQLFEDTEVHLPSGDWKHKDVSIFFDDPRWTEEAYNRFKDEAFVKRLEKVFDKLPFDVVIMPVNENKKFNLDEFAIHKGFRTKLPLVPSIARFFLDLFDNSNGFRSKQLNLKKVNKQVAKFISSKIKKNNLVVIISSNFQVEDHIDITPWTIAHGISHAVEDSRSVNPDEFDKDFYNVVRKLCKMTSDAYGFGWADKLSNSHITNYNDARSDTSLLPPEYITPYFNFKSARENEVIHSGEFYNETFSQFMITGKVKMNKQLPDKLLGKSMVNPDAIDIEFLNRVEKLLNTEYQKIVDRLKGKVVVCYDE